MDTSSPLDAYYWDQRYLENRLGWDIGYPSPPLKEYIDQLSNKALKILIPGAGNAYEAEYLWEQGFTDTHIVDISKEALRQFSERVPTFPKANMNHSDFFELQGSYDLILEQTFFCALAPNLRDAYVKKMNALLQPKGQLVGLLFDFPLTAKGPPFGGDTAMYRDYFHPLFKIKTLAPAYNSIPERQGNELFAIFSKQDGDHPVGQPKEEKDRDTI